MTDHTSCNKNIRKESEDYQRDSKIMTTNTEILVLPLPSEILGLSSKPYLYEG